jgi:prepilin-type N-terminal cleavage/methylation domain-containing protein
MIQKIRNKLGFTLIELMIVIAIVAILIAIMIPMIVGLKDNLTDSEIEIVDQSQDNEPEQQIPEKEVEQKL